MRSSLHGLPKSLFIALLLVAFSLLPDAVRADHSDKDILILHSYHPDLSWTAGINAAMQEQLLAKRPDLALHVEYLDTKRNQSDWYRDNYLEHILIKKLEGHRFSLILSSDNDAFNFLLRHRNGLFAGIPMVFCGVNGFTPELLSGIDNVTGIAEIPAFEKTVDLALHLQPDTRELIFIGETITETGRKNDQDLKRIVAQLKTGIRSRIWNDLSLNELENRLKVLTSGQVVFLVGTIRDNEITLSFAESAQQVRRHSPVPIYGFWDFFLGNGIVGGRLTSSEAQGDEAARIALKILNGTPPRSIPVKSSEANRFMFDYKELDFFNIPVDRLPANSHVINLPAPYYKLDKWQVRAGIIFIILMSFIIFLLLFINSIRRRAAEAITERARQASLTAEIGRALVRNTTLHEALQRCCENLLKLTGTAFARFWVIDENDPELLELHASAGLSTRIEASPHRFKRLGELKVGIIASERQPILTNQVHGDPLFSDQPWVIRENIVAFAGYPLIVNDRVVGVIALFAKNPLTRSVQDSIASVADMIAVGIERYRTAQALQKSAHEAEAGHDNIDAILRSVADGLLVTDLEQKVVLINETAESLLDIKFAQACCQPLSKVLEGRPYARQLQTLLQSSEAESEFSLPGPAGGGERMIHARTAKIKRRDGSSGGIVAVLHDVTRLRELDQMKSEFIAVAAHELRTPLATIRGYAELMHTPELQAKISAEHQHEYLGYIVDRSDALERIIDDLLDVGRAESGRKTILERSPCEMISLVHEIISHHKKESPDYSFVTDCPAACLKLNIDRNLMHRVFDNLLSNAVKYSPAGGTIRICGQMREQDLMITVADEGIGMTPEQASQACNKFYRANTADTAVRGLGLGLTICKTIIDAHDGALWIDSTPGQGTMVHFSLPLETDHPAAAGISGQNRAGNANRDIPEKI